MKRMLPIYLISAAAKFYGAKLLTAPPVQGCDAKPAASSGAAGSPYSEKEQCSIGGGRQVGVT